MTLAGGSIREDPDVTTQRLAIHCLSVLNTAAFWKSTLSGNLALAALLAVFIVLALLALERRDL